MSIFLANFGLFSLPAPRQIWARGYVSCIANDQMSVLSKESLTATDKLGSGQCAPDVALPWLHAYPEDQKSAGVAFCQPRRCKICKEKKRERERKRKRKGGRKNKQRERTSKQSRTVQTQWQMKSLSAFSCLQPRRLTPLDESVGVCGRNLDGDQWKRCQGDSNCKLR